MREQFWKCFTAQLDTLVPEYELRFVMAFQCDSGTAKNVKKQAHKICKKCKKTVDNCHMVWYYI